jgi:hypothetical protein
VDPKGQLQWEKKQQVIDRETQRDGWYLLHTNCPAPACSKEQVLAHYKGLLDVEDELRQKFCYRGGDLKSG